MGGRTATKAGYFDKLKALLEEYKSVFIVTVDNVSSQQMHEIRHSMRGTGVVLMGKNTMVRRAIKTFIADFPEYERLLPHVKGNVGFVFTNGELKEIRDKILSNRVAAPARAGAVAPADVFIPAGNTGMEPGKTSFFQALGVPTKIARGTIEITTDLKLVEANTKVGASEATLLNMLNISPFTYGMGISQIYDQGQTFATSVLDIEEDQLLKAFNSAIATIVAVSLASNYPTLASINYSFAIGMKTSIKNITAISLASNYPTWPSVFHSVINSYKNLLAVALETEYEWPAISSLKAGIRDPSSVQQAAPTEAAPEAKAEAPKEEAKKEESEEEDEDMGFGLFD
ncbi:60s acidic ribosomal protein P2 [Oleoguttula mirabilis]|uniref:Large ribosomal subunit protein uL10 n=1 Tax=Oleoguttula mirabilis TaxID=1507867 RepID=A0AAV9JWS0_9PEZI|nr:60s acidic ribosomal protein P2 [Oleoguttula mirabilis]